MTDSDTQLRSVYIWVCEGTWRASVDAALSLAPAGARFTLLHVTSAEVPDAAHGAYAGLFGRGHRAVDDPGTRLEKMAATSASDLLDAAAARLGRRCERLEVQGRPERAVVAASADADLLVVARDGDRTRLGPKSLGKITRFVVDHAACPVLLVWPESAPDVATIPPPPHHPPAATSPSPAGPLEPRNPDTAREPVGADSGRALWLAATLADERSITSGPDCLTARAIRHARCAGLRPARHAEARRRTAHR